MEPPLPALLGEGPGGGWEHPGVGGRRAHHHTEHGSKVHHKLWVLAPPREPSNPSVLVEAAGHNAGQLPKGVPSPMLLPFQREGHEVFPSLFGEPLEGAVELPEGSLAVEHRVLGALGAMAMLMLLIETIISSWGTESGQGHIVDRNHNFFVGYGIRAGS